MMRFLTLALLASAALPVAAQAQEDGERPRTGMERREAAASGSAPRFERPRFDGGASPDRSQVDRGPRPDRAQFDRGSRGDQPSFTPPAQVQPGAPPAGRDFRGDDQRGGWQGNRGHDAGTPSAPAPVAGRAPDPQQHGGGRDWNGRDRNDNGRWNSDGRNRSDGRNWDNDRRGWDNDGRGWNGGGHNRGDGRGWNNGGSGWNDGRGWNNGGGNRDYRNWDRGWRNDRRYDWQGYRQSNRSAYRLPRYSAPYDWNYGYRSFGVGASLFSGLFAQNYWISDPWAYRLPPADWPYRWVRYYDDALLVDTRSGVVVDVIPGIFW